MQHTQLRPGLIIRPSVMEDAYNLGPNLREADLAELDAASGSDPCEVLGHGLLHGRVCLTIEREGRPIAMFGTVDHPETSAGIIWMLGSPEIEEVAISILRASRRYLPLLTEPYDYVTNLVDCRNVLHIRWLAWLGCQMVAIHKDHGRHEEDFLEFIYQAPDHV